MPRLLVALSRLVVCSPVVLLSVGQALVGAQIGVSARDSLGPPCPIDGGAEARPAGVETTALVLTGRVLGPNGIPREGAVVVTSAGGRALTDARGSYRLEVDVPLDASSVQVTASAGRAGGATATRQVTLTGSNWTPSETLVLEEDGCCEGSWVPTFGEFPGVGGGSGLEVYALTVFDDGSGPALYVGGDFTLMGGVAANNIAKWDGSSWSSLGSGVNASVRALTVFDDGSGPALYAGGDFKFAGGSSANRIARWDGSSWSALGTGMSDTNDGVRSLTGYDDGSGPALYAGGRFTRAGGILARSIAKWNGTGWSAVGGGLDAGYVYALSVFDDGGGPLLYAGGEFTTAGGASASRIARWDGSNWSALGSGMSGSFVYALAVHDDGGGPRLYAGGQFTSAGGVVANNIAKWDGSSWAALGGGVGTGGLFDAVYSLAYFDDGGGPGLYVGGGFTIADGATANRVARWDGSSWSAVGGGMIGATDFVAALCAFDAGTGPKLFAGGGFRSAGGVYASRVADWDGSSWHALGTGMNSSVAALVTFDDGSGPALYAGGSFTVAGGATLNRIGRWNGASWSGLAGGMNNTVASLVVYDDGDGPALYAGGAFTAAGGVAANRVARWDGSTWSELGGGTSGFISALAVYDDGNGPALYAGGLFSSAGGTAANYIAKWDGSSWSALGSGMDYVVSAFAVFDDGSGLALYAGGGFVTAGGVTTNRIARWNGSSWSALGGGMNDNVSALTVFDDGGGPALYAGGAFIIVGGVSTNRIARWNGSSWSPLGSGTNTDVVTMTAFDDGNGPALYAGGSFTTAGGMAANRIARWSGSSWSPLGGGMSSHVDALLVFDDGTGEALYAGGAFTSAIDSHDSFLAKWRCLDTTPPIITCPPAVLVADDRATPGENVNFQVTASDPCGPAPAVVCVPPSGSFFPRGTTVVTCTATDAAGNEATCSFPVTVSLPPRSRVR